MRPLRRSTATGLAPVAAGLVLLAGLSACGGDADPDLLTAAVDTIDGVEHLSYPAESAGTLDWSLDTLAVIGDAFAEDAYQFTTSADGGLAADAQGNLYVLDRQGGRILKYGPDGNHLATFGRSGGGPGELGQPISLAVGPGDTVWVSDWGNTRFTGFPQDGSDPRSAPLPEGVIPGLQLAALDGGFVTIMRPLFGIRAGRGGFSIGGAAGEEEDSDEPPTLPLLSLDGSLAVQDTLWAAPEPPMDMVQLESAGRVMVTMMQREFHPDFQWAALAGGGVVLADTAAYLLHLLDADGSVVRAIARAPAPRPTTEADRELARQRIRDESGGGVSISAGDGGGDSDNSAQDEMLRQRLEKMTFAEVLPRIVGLQVDPSGRIWVGVSEDTPDEVDRIDVYDPDGTLLGELRDFPLPDVFLGTDRIGVLQRDEFDVQQVVIMDVNRAAQDVADR